MKVARSKRGVDAIGFIVGATIALVIAFILISLYYRVPGWFGQATSCEKNGGVCTDTPGACPEEYRTETVRSCTEKGKTCCMPNFIRTGEASRFTTAQRTALANPIFLTIENNPNPIDEIKLDEGQDLKAYLRFNDKLPEKDFGPVIVYLVDQASVEKPVDYYFYSQKKGGTGQGAGEGINSPVGASGIIKGIKETGTSLDFLNPKNSLVIHFKPELRHTHGKYTLYVVALDNSKIRCRDKINYDKEYLSCLEDIRATTYSYSSEKESEIKSLLSDKSYYLASKSYRITITPVLEVSGVSTNWVAEDSITVKANKPGFSELNFSLINAATLKSLAEISNACESKADGLATPFVSKITNIVGTTTETAGVPLNFNLGGFRIPTSTIQLKYLVQQTTPKMVGGKAEFKIDKAAMIKDFYEKARNAESLMVGENAYLCVQAINEETEAVAYAVSKSPIKVDVLPPLVIQEEIRIQYPDLKINTPQYSQQYPSIAGQSAFYSSYPKVIIPCSDYGQSGCASYDYYLRTGNYVNVRVTSENWQDAVTGIALQAGLNGLFDYFAKKDPENTVCPYIHSSEYRLNRNSVISLRTTGQGIICIRVKDNVGNARLYWKEIYTPTEMMKRVAAEALDVAVSEASGKLVS
jgi:hypothetical protein